MLSKQELIDYNTRKHDEIAAIEGDQSYDARHIEIFNPTEQRRLAGELNRALAHRRTTNPRILDFGCGTGNLTEKLLGPSRQVWAVDVSGGMCDLVKRRFAHAFKDGELKTETLTGEFPLPFPDNHFSFIATYSVLHHVPDYEMAVRELVRVLDHGGVLYIDHEASADS
ncbi:class I SAM-dependent methyltransferase [bacterium]|nr:class I SAM-dependent methyltransferase [bacterium]